MSVEWLGHQGFRYGQEAEGRRRGEPAHLGPVANGMDVCLCACCVVVRTQHQIHPCSTSLSLQYSIVSYRHHAAQQIARTYSSCKLETWYPFLKTLLIPLPPVPDTYHSTLCFYEFDCFFGFFT